MSPDDLLDVLDAWGWADAEPPTDWNEWESVEAAERRYESEPFDV